MSQYLGDFPSIKHLLLEVSDAEVDVGEPINHGVNVCSTVTRSKPAFCLLVDDSEEPEIQS